MKTFRDQRYETGFPEGEGAELPLGHRNRYHAAWNFLEGRTTLDTAPTSLQVARNNLCNFKCVYCTDHFPGNTMPRSLIQDAAWEELVELLPRAEMVAFHGISEFMIDPKFFEIVELCAQHRLSLSINTNGSVCTPAHLDLLGNYPGFLDLFVSLDAATPATFERVRGWDFFRVIDNLRAYLERFRENRGWRSVTISFVVMRSNVHEMVPAVYLAAMLGVDFLRFYRLHEYGFSWTTQAKDGSTFVYQEETTENFAEAYNRGLDEARQAAELLGVRIDLPTRFDMHVPASGGAS